MGKNAVKKCTKLSGMLKSVFIFSKHTYNSLRTSNKIKFKFAFEKLPYPVYRENDGAYLQTELAALAMNS